MKFEEFLGHVQHRAHLGSMQEAVRATRATLETLSERLFYGEKQNIAAQLPHEIGEIIRHIDGSEKFDLHEFFTRVGAREQVDLPVAVHHARVVAEVLREAVDAGAFHNLEVQLPPEFRPLFSGSAGRLGGPGRSS